MLFLFSLLDYPQLIIGFVLGALCILLIVKVFFSLFGPRHYGGRYDRYPPYGGYGEQEHRSSPSSSGCLPLIVLLLIGMVVLKYTLRSNEAPKVVEKVKPQQQSEVKQPQREAQKTTAPARQEEGQNQQIYKADKSEGSLNPPIKTLVPKPGQYFLQTNFFREVPNAESYCRALQNKGLPTCIVERQGSRFWGYAACAGPYKSWEDAVNAKQAWGNDKWELFGEMDW